MARWFGLACAFGVVLGLSRAPGDPPAPSTVPPVAAGCTVYDADPGHLWNRLHDEFRVRLEGDGPADPDELDPLLRRDRSPYEEKGERYQHAAALLDEFRTQRGDRLITDPRKRALLQRDLWALFDALTPAQFLMAPPRRVNGDAELARRLARIVPRLALTAAEIEALPDNLTEAVKAKRTPDDMDAGRLGDANGPWVLVGSAEEMPLARSHVDIFGGRSAFFVFLRLPGGREATLKHLEQLREGRAEPVRAGEASFALVRRLQLIDDRGRLVLSPVTETVQFRGPTNHELKLRRREFLAGRPSLVALGPEDRERNELTLLGRNLADTRGKVLGSCATCHGGMPMQSIVRHVPPAVGLRPILVASGLEAEAMRARRWKIERYEWGLLQGLSLAASGGE